MGRWKVRSSDEVQNDSRVFQFVSDKRFVCVCFMFSYEWAGSLLKLTSPSLFNQAANEPARVQATKSFSMLVTDLARFIPKDTLKLTEVDTMCSNRIQFLKLRIALLKLMSAGKYQDILHLESAILSHLERTTETFDTETLEKLMKCILPHDHIRGLEFGLKIATQLKRVANFGLFISLSRLFFSPTIYDRVDELHSSSTVSSNGQHTSFHHDEEDEQSEHTKHHQPHNNENDESEDENSVSRSDNSTADEESSNTGTAAVKTRDRAPSTSAVRPSTNTQPPITRPPSASISSPPAAGGNRTLMHSIVSGWY